jgi:hypothetical protein
MKKSNPKFGGKPVECLVPIRWRESDLMVRFVEKISF